MSGCPIHSLLTSQIAHSFLMIPSSRALFFRDERWSGLSLTYMSSSLHLLFFDDP